MAKVLRPHELHEIVQEFRSNGQLREYCDKSEVWCYYPLGLGRGLVRKMHRRPGLNLYIRDSDTNFTYINKIRHHPVDMPFTFKYYLAGVWQIDNDGLGGAVEEVAGKSYLYRLPKTGEIERQPPGRHCFLHIQVAPELMFELCDRIDDFPMPLRDTLEKPADSILYHPSKITPSQHRIIQQIFEWPYQGLARHLYLEGKVLELIALHISQILSTSHTSSINPMDSDRIHTARDILIQNAAAPPSLRELAQQVELTEVRLTQGFREVFNTSVFNYLRNYRMEQACQLLKTGNLTIQEVARSIGYASRPAFVTAFKKRFKVTPSIYLKQ
ncbi:transcriptional family [Leptolyngbya sp. Heron Island J]|uniref:helix-turn-helix transcriptional regulator n=1 Tax=Leptolyngbya sp. Heron Island J TaxID=1385935 RepID=UPI0003B9AE84|nr:AraC family transcriptional regulator [Leptolyngbya sp. Heron Island J]ESA35328.1 transcriptional family [Leptolyngbya sp. Heron Island J]